METPEDNLQSVAQNFVQSVNQSLNNNPELAQDINKTLSNLVSQELLSDMLCKITQKCSLETMNNAVNGAIKFSEDFDKNPNVDFLETDMGKKLQEITDHFINDPKTSELLGEDDVTEPSNIINFCRNIIEEGSIIDMIGSMFQQMNN